MGIAELVQSAMPAIKKCHLSAHSWHTASRSENLASPLAHMQQGAVVWYRYKRSEWWPCRVASISPTFTSLHFLVQDATKQYKYISADKIVNFADGFRHLFRWSNGSNFQAAV